jgi:putative phosphoesterase
LGIIVYQISHLINYNLPINPFTHLPIIQITQLPNYPITQKNGGSGKMENIKQVGIMSDSHDNMPAIRAAVELFNERKVDLVIHAGDLVAPFTAREIKKLKCPYKIILGNNDGEILGLYRIYEGNVYHPPYQFKVNDKKVLVLHDPILLNTLKNCKSVDIIIYGHDHNASISESPEGQLLVNPGECGGWLTGRHSVAIWNVIRHEVELIDLSIDQ